MSIFGWIVLVLGVVFVAILASCVKIVRQSTAIVIERLGKYHRTLDTGVHIILPFFDKASSPINLKELVADFAPQPVITKDNVTMQIDTVVYYQITDPRLYCYGVDRPIKAIENLTATTLRNIVGELELDETLTSRDTVNSKMRLILDEATDPWGIKINRVELKNILPPRDIQEAMEKQMRAERERREQILKAEGEKKSSILVAEGEKEAKILKAEADKQSEILRAEADKEAEILRAEAKRIALIKEAEGTANAIQLIVDAKADNAYITLQGFEALKKVADGRATKIIVPSEIQNITGLVTSIAETIKTETPTTSQKEIEEKTATISKNSSLEKAKK